MAHRVHRGASSEIEAMTLLRVGAVGKDGVCSLLRAYARRLEKSLKYCYEKTEFLLAVLDEEERASLIAETVALAEKHGRPIEEDEQPSPHDSSELARELDRLSNRIDRKRLEAFVEEKLRSLLESQDDTGEGVVPAPQCFTANLGDFKEIFRLTESDCGIVLFYYAYTLCSEFEALFDRVALQLKPRFMAVCTGLPETDIISALSSKASLISSGLLLRDDARNLTDVKISSMLLDGLSGFIGSMSHERFCTRSTEARYELAEFGLGATELEVMKALLSIDEPCNILLYGPPGTGKTEFAKSLIASSGKEAWFLENGRTGSVEDRQAGLALSAATLSRARQVLVVDEADTLLAAAESIFMAPRSMSKSWINNFLEGAKAQTIWIVNWISGIDESAKRRFNFSRRFEAFTPGERRRIWSRSALQRKLTLEAGLVDALAEDYAVNAAGIDRAIAALRVVYSTNGESKPEPILRAVLDNQMLLSKGSLPPRERPISKEYDPSLLSLSIDAGELEAAIGRHVARDDDTPGAGPRFLFWGPPGTGKTEFCRYLASRFGKKIIIRRASDLFDMYVGGTEKNIAAAFHEAGREKAFLLFDEADSFLGDRTLARHSWEVSHVNEFLTQLERFSGVLACCTNRKDGLDAASLRRFQFKVQFKPLEPEALARLISLLFPTIVVPAAWRSDLAPVTGIATPGDLEAVRERLRLCDRQDSWGLVLDELAKELAVGERARAIGFPTA